MHFASTIAIAVCRQSLKNIEQRKTFEFQIDQMSIVCVFCLYILPAQPLSSLYC